MGYNSRQMQRALGVVWSVVGLAIVGSHNAGGWLFVLLGLAYIWKTTAKGEAWAQQHPKAAQRAITSFTVLAALVVVVAIVFREME